MTLQNIRTATTNISDEGQQRYIVGYIKFDLHFNFFTNSTFATYQVAVKPT